MPENRGRTVDERLDEKGSVKFVNVVLVRDCLVESAEAGRNVIVGNCTVCYGALSRYLGALATTLERWDDAARHFEDALAMNARMDARPWLAHTQKQYAAMLLARHQSGDRDKAADLLDAALAIARELGMRALEERITAAIAQIKPDLH